MTMLSLANFIIPRFMTLNLNNHALRTYRFTTLHTVDIPFRLFRNRNLYVLKHTLTHPHTHTYINEVRLLHLPLHNLMHIIIFTKKTLRVLFCSCTFFRQFVPMQQSIIVLGAIMFAPLSAYTLHTKRKKSSSSLWIENGPSYLRLVHFFSPVHFILRFHLLLWS